MSGDDKIINFPITDESDVIWQCTDKELDPEGCGCITFYILEKHYECTKCGKEFTFDDVHGSID